MNQLIKNILWMVLGGIIVLGGVLIYQQQTTIQELESQNLETTSEDSATRNTLADLSEQEDDTLLYTNEEYGFSLELPKNWEGYEVRKIKASNMLSVGFQGRSWNELFYVVMHTHNKWNQISNDMQAQRGYVGENNQFVFTLNRPVEAPLDEDFRKYLSDINSIKDSFKAF